MNLVISKCVTEVKVSDFSGHYLRNRSTLDIGVLGYIGIVQHKEDSPEVLSISPGTPCISFLNGVNVSTAQPEAGRRSVRIEFEDMPLYKLVIFHKKSLELKCLALC